MPFWDSPEIDFKYYAWNFKNKIFLRMVTFFFETFFHILPFHFGKDFENPYQKNLQKKIGQKVKIMKIFHFLKFHK